MNRAQALKKHMGIGAHQAVLLCNPSNMFYASGYTGEGMVLVTEDLCAVITDFRYTEQAQQQAPGFDVHMTDKSHGHEDIVAGLCLEKKIDQLYYEDDFVTVHDAGKLREAARGVEWKPVAGAVEQLRELKDPDEQALMEKACQITGDTFERILPQIKPGMTEKQIAALLEYDMRCHGADRPSFSSIVAAGVNGSLPHATPSDYAVRTGDMITLDFGAKVGGYCADMTRTIALGEPSAELKKVYQVVKDAQQMAQDAVKAGKACRAIDAIARDYIAKMGYDGRFGHGLGHSLGIDIHEDPRFNTKTGATLKAGQMMTVEPGIYLPGIGGVRIENKVLVTGDGCRALTKPTRELIILS